MPDDDQTPAADRVTALTLRNEDLREQRDLALEAHDIVRDVLADVLRDLDQARAEVDQARATIAAVEAAIASWPPGVRKGDVYRALGEGK